MYRYIDRYIHVYEEVLRRYALKAVARDKVEHFHCHITYDLLLLQGEWGNGSPKSPQKIHLERNLYSLPHSLQAPGG